MKRWHLVPMSELRRIWHAQAQAGICYNGCTHAALVDRYGARVKHVRGHGWYKLIDCTTAPGRR